MEHDRIIERAKAAMFSRIGGTVSPPAEWHEYRLCRLLHCLPQDLDNMEEDKVLLFLEFANIEAEAGRIRGIPPLDA